MAAESGLGVHFWRPSFAAKSGLGVRFRWLSFAAKSGLGVRSWRPSFVAKSGLGVRFWRPSFVAKSGLGVRFWRPSFAAKNGLGSTFPSPLLRPTFGARLACHHYYARVETISFPNCSLRSSDTHTCIHAAEIIKGERHHKSRQSDPNITLKQPKV